MISPSILREGSVLRPVQNVGARATNSVVEKKEKAFRSRENLKEREIKNTE